MTPVGTKKASSKSVGSFDVVRKLFNYYQRDGLFLRVDKIKLKLSFRKISRAFLISRRKKNSKKAEPEAILHLGRSCVSSKNPGVVCSLFVPLENHTINTIFCLVLVR